MDTYLKLFTYSQIFQLIQNTSLFVIKCASNVSCLQENVPLNLNKNIDPGFELMYTPIKWQHLEKDAKSEEPKKNYLELRLEAGSTSK